MTACPVIFISKILLLFLRLVSREEISMGLKCILFLGLGKRAEVLKVGFSVQTQCFLSLSEIEGGGN